MPRQYRTREGEATAVDTKTQLTTLGSETAPGALVVPAGKTKIVAVMAAATGNHAAATGYSAFIRLEGSGLAGGPETFAVCSGGSSVATGGNHTVKAQTIPVELEVVPGSEVLIYGEMAGTDVGQVSFGVTLVFSE